MNSSSFINSVNIYFKAQSLSEIQLQKCTLRNYGTYAAYITAPAQNGTRIGKVAKKIQRTQNAIRIQMQKMDGIKYTEIPFKVITVFITQPGRFICAFRVKG